MSNTDNTDNTTFSGNFRPFRWTSVRDLAAEKVADDYETEVEIAALLNITDRTLRYWKQHPEFQARVAERRAAQRAAIEARGLAERDNRLAGYQDRYDRLQRVIEERAADASMAEIPGGKTGLLVREIKFVKVFKVEVDEAGEETSRPTPLKQYEQIEVYSVDTGTLKEMDNLAKQAAQDLGQWVTKGELTGKDGEPLIKSYLGVDLEEI